MTEPPPFDRDAKLARMANDIANGFSALPEPDRAHAVATHIRQFWDPRMRRALGALAAEGRLELKPAVRDAVRALGL